MEEIRCYEYIRNAANGGNTMAVVALINGLFTRADTTETTRNMMRKGSIPVKLQKA